MEQISNVGTPIPHRTASLASKSVSNFHSSFTLANAGCSCDLLVRGHRCRRSTSAAWIGERLRRPRSAPPDIVAPCPMTWNPSCKKLHRRTSQR